MAYSYSAPLAWFYSALDRYRPLGAVVEMAALTGLGWIIYRRSYVAGNIVPTEDAALAAMKETGEAPPEYIRFSSFIYSLENSLPLVKLGQSDKWKPIDQPISIPIVKRAIPHARSTLIRRGHKVLEWCGLRFKANKTPLLAGPPFVRWFLWCQILLGWLLATLFAAGVSGIVHGK
jgi:hypothetical protein